MVREVLSAMRIWAIKLLTKDEVFKMSIYDEEKRLFNKWHKDWKDPNSFVGDGVVCETAYSESNPKIAIILKEPHGGNEGDIRKWIRDVNSSDRSLGTLSPDGCME